jgi:MFS family permease
MSASPQATGAARATAVTRAMWAVLAVFALNGFVFAAWVSRLPGVRDQLELTPSRLGIVLLVGTAGSLVSLPLTGAFVERFGTGSATRWAAATSAAGFTGAALCVSLETAVGVAMALFVAAFGIGAWDVSMNLQGAQVEHELGRSVMPRFHAAFSLGAVAGAGSGALAAAGGVSVPVHVIASVVAAVALAALAVRAYLPAVEHAIGAPVGHSDAADDPDPVDGPYGVAGPLSGSAVSSPPSGSAASSPPSGSAASSPPSGSAEGRPSVFLAWTEPRTVLIGLVVMAAALIEGSATDWLALAVVDGFGSSNAVGALAFGAFTAAMTIFRLAGTALLDRFGRVAVLRSLSCLALVGLLLFTLTPALPLALVGVVAWGLGAALGFPVGMSAAADDPARAAARVSVVSSIGYVAFLAGPPLLGLLADHVGYRRALLAIAVPLVVSLVLSPAVRPLPARTSRAPA